MLNNIYIETLKIGAENLDKGISYSQVVEQLTQIGISIEPYFEEYFMLWFFTNFYERSMTNIIRTQSNRWFRKEEYGSALNFPVILTGEAYQNYLDYIELKEAREYSLQAQKAANESIKIARLTLIVSIGVAIAGIIISLI